MKRIEDSEKFGREALQAVSSLKEQLDSAQQENYTLRTALSDRDMPNSEHLRSKLDFEGLKKEKRDLIERVKQLKAKLLKQDMIGFQLKRENIQLKDQLSTQPKATLQIKTASTEMTEDVHRSKRPGSKVPIKSRSRSDLRKVQSRTDLTKKSIGIKKLFERPEEPQIDQNSRIVRSKHSRSILAPFDTNSSLAAESKGNMVDLTLDHPRKKIDIKEVGRSASVSRLGRQLNNLEEELRAEKNLNNKIKQKIAHMLMDGSSNLIGTSSRAGPLSENSDPRSTTTTIDSKRGHVLNAFSKFSKKIEKIKEIVE